MKRLVVAAHIATCLSLTLHSLTSAQVPPASGAVKPEKVVTIHASGTFDVKLNPVPATEGSGLGRMSIDKQFHGDLEGTSKGEMLAFSSTVSGSAGYVAMEQVTGTLKGRHGTFVLQHSGTMARGAPSLTVTVVPDSGTDGLVGITGTLMIKIDGGKHFYEFEYTIARAP